MKKPVPGPESKQHSRLTLLLAVLACPACLDTFGLTSEVQTSGTSAHDSSGDPATTQLPTSSTGPSSDDTADPTSAGDTTGLTQAMDAGTSTSAAASTDESGTATTDAETTTGEDPCVLQAMHIPCDGSSADVLHAFGIDCTSLGDPYVDGHTAVAATYYNFMTPAPLAGKQAWQVARSYGSWVDPDTQLKFWSAREGERFLMLSSGLLPAPNGQGAVLIADGDVYNDSFVGSDMPPFDDNVLPPPMSPDHGSPSPMGYSACDGLNDCSNSLRDQWLMGASNPEDKIWLHIKVQVPALADGDLIDAHGYSFDFSLFSSEFPEYVDTQFNDIFVAWQGSASYTGNVAVLDAQPITVTSTWPIDHPDGDPGLAGTGYAGEGGATGWYRVRGGVNPGETLEMVFAIFDMGDSSFDSTVLLDNWRWDCDGCPQNVPEGCPTTLE